MNARKVIIIIALIGLLFSVYSITLHYAPAGSSICNVNETFNCDKVNKSPWATLFGIPVSILGTIAYLTVFLLALKQKAVLRKTGLTDKDFWGYMLLLTAIMCSFQLYLTMIEIFKIYAYCIACLGSQACTLLLTFFSAKEYLRK